MKTDAMIPQLATARLVLRAPRLNDADFIFKEWSDPEVTLYMRDQEPLKVREQAEEYLRTFLSPAEIPTQKWWGIEEKEGRQLIGTCGFFRWDEQHHRAEIGYDLCPDRWGRALMPEALTALIRHGFDQMRLNRIEATTHVENRRSQRVLEKLGFQREGLLREYYCQNGIYNDQVQFSLLRKEWLELIISSDSTLSG